LTSVHRAFASLCGVFSKTLFEPGRRDLYSYHYRPFTFVSDYLISIIYCQQDVPKNRQLVLLGEEKDYSIWHRRFMHYSPEIVKKTIAEYLEFDAKVPSDNCPTCVKSKMVFSKQSQVHERQSTKSFEKLHIDGGEFPVR
jgi:hypothetical protein